MSVPGAKRSNSLSTAPSIVVIGSVNLDLAASVERLPVAGETVTGASLNRFPGGKGANQALAARRLGADVSLVARIGDDSAADDALTLLRAGGVNLELCSVDNDAPTGIALISVASSGENHIVVAPGANRKLELSSVDLPVADALMCQLEVPVAVLSAAAKAFAGFFCVNLAPAAEVPPGLIGRADLVVVNETEAAFYGDAVFEAAGLVGITYGADGAVLKRRGEVVAEAKPPRVEAIDTVGAGDAFTAALTVALVEDRDLQGALEFACAAGAAAATRHGAQPSLPTREEVEALLR